MKKKSDFFSPRELQNMIDRKSGRKSKTELFLRALPKAELHIHGTALNTLNDIAPMAWERSGKTKGRLQERFKTLANLKKYFDSPLDGTLTKYLERYDILKDEVIQDLGVIRELSYLGAKRYFENGTQILEVRTSIKAGKHGDPRSKVAMQGVSFSGYDEICARVKGFQKAEREFKNKPHTYLIITFRRQESPKNLLKLLDEVILIRKKIRDQFGRDYLIGVDIAGTEYNHHAKPFENVFMKARESGLSVTAHAGEELGSGEGSVRHAINAGAQRIGHGTSFYLPTPMLDPKNIRAKDGVIKNALIMALLFGTATEMCLTSNLSCGAGITVGYERVGDRIEPIMRAFAKYSDYPADLITALGGLVYTGRRPILPLPCCDGVYTLNTDLAREYAIACQTFEWNECEVLAVALESLHHSFAPAEEKAFAIKAWRDFAKKYLNDPRFASPDEEAQHHLKSLRRKKREKLGIDDSLVQEIIKHVHTPEFYMRNDLLDKRLYRHLRRVG